MTSSRLFALTVSFVNTRPPLGSWAKAPMARSISLPLRTRNTIGATANDRFKCTHVHGRGEISWVGYVRRPRHVGYKFLERFKQLPTLRLFEISKARDVATWPGQALHKAKSDRIGHGGEHDRDMWVLALYCSDCRPGIGQDHVRFQAHQLGGIYADPVSASGPSN